jgi:hypothetical protein
MLIINNLTGERFIPGNGICFYQMINQGFKKYLVCKMNSYEENSCNYS